MFRLFLIFCFVIASYSLEAVVEGELTPEQRQEFAERFSPIVFLHSQERYYPSSLEWYLLNDKVSLRKRTAYPEFKLLPDVVGSSFQSLEFPFKF